LRVDEAERRLAPAAPQPAMTEYRRLATMEVPAAIDRFPTARYALMSLVPLTGRRHQLRRHLKHIAHPILGDATFGKGRHNRFFAELVGTTRLWLHALELAFDHPVSGARTRIAAPLGEEWRPVLDRFGVGAADLEGAAR
jgi:tRNA pseudouridine65 synthase